MAAVEDRSSVGAEPTPSPDRRAFLASASALAGLGLTSAAIAAEHGEHQGPQSTHHGDDPNGASAVRRAARECVVTGDDCLAHCMEEFKAGRTHLADCAIQVRELSIACRALAQLASHDSEHLAAFAEAAAKVCSTCEQECRRHEQHAVCAACADACRACISACERAASA